MNGKIITNTILRYRWYDNQWKRWEAWEEIKGRELEEKYGVTVEDWKYYSQAWVDLGGAYEYQIVKRTETIIWDTISPLITK